MSIAPFLFFHSELDKRVFDTECAGRAASYCDLLYNLQLYVLYLCIVRLYVLYVLYDLQLYDCVRDESIVSATVG